MTCNKCGTRESVRFVFSLGYCLPCVDKIDQDRAKQGFDPINWRKTQ